MKPQFEDDHQSDSVGRSESERSLDEDGDGSLDEDGDEGCDGNSGGEKLGDDCNISAGWAEAMAKILGKKTPDSKNSILVKNKELEKIKEKERQEQLERKKQVTHAASNTLADSSQMKSFMCFIV